MVTGLVVNHEANVPRDFIEQHEPCCTLCIRQENLR